MRSYFQCHIGGSRLFVLWLLALVLAAGASAAVRLVLPEPQADPVFDGRFLLGILGYMLGGICLLAAQCLVYYRFVQATLRGSSLYGEAIEAEYDPKRYLRLCAKNILLSVVTCGIWLPWMVVSLIRYFASPVIHRLFLCEEPIYRGRGSVLFAYGVLFGVVPVVIIPFAAACFVLTGGMAVSGVLLLIVAVGLLACLKALTLRYFVNFEVGRKRLCTTIRSWRAGGFVFGQFLLGLLRHGDVLALPHPQLHRPVEPGDVQPPHRVLLRVPGGGVGLGPVLRLGIGQFRQAEALGGKAHRRRGAQEQASQSPGHRRKDLSPLHGSPPFPGSVAACAASL